MGGRTDDRTGKTAVLCGVQTPFAMFSTCFGYLLFSFPLIFWSFVERGGGRRFSNVFMCGAVLYGVQVPDGMMYLFWLFFFPMIFLSFVRTVCVSVRL